MRLENVLYLNYLLPASRLAPVVDPVLHLALLDGDKVFISVVVLKSTGVHLSPLPLPRFTYYQLNVRTYVKDPQSGAQAVYFLKSGVTSAATAFLTRSIGIPWQHVDFDMKCVDQDGSASFEFAGNWDGEFALKARGTTQRPASLPPFKDPKPGVDYLVRPLIGFFGQDGRVRRFRIRHPEIEPYLGQLDDFRFPALASAGLLEENEAGSPHNVLFVPEARFYIYLPPSTLKRQ